jgi:hypothetical protein
LAALFFMTPEASLYVTAMLFCVCAAELAAWQRGSTLELRQPWFWSVSPAAVCALALLAHRSIETDPLPLSVLSWVDFTMFQALWFTVLGVCVGALMTAAARASVNARSNLAATGVAVAVVSVAVLCGAFLFWSGNLAGIVERLLGANRLYVAEETFVLHSGFWRAPPWYRILCFSGLGLLVELVASFRLRRGSSGWFKWIMLSAALVIGLKEYRHLYVFSSIQLVGLAVIGFEAEQHLRRLPIFSVGAKMLVPGAALLAATVPFFLAGDIANRASLRADACEELPVLEELATWLREESPPPAQPGQTVPDYGVFGPWGIGHHVHVLGDRPVVVDPLNYETENSTEQALQAVWLAKSGEELVNALQRYQVRYLVLTNPGEAVVGILRKSQATHDQFARVSLDGRITFLPAMNQFAGFRLFMSGGMSGEFGALEPRFFSAESEIYTVSVGGQTPAHEVAIPKGQIYEIKPGARIRGTVPSGEEIVTLMYTLARRGAEPLEARIPIPVIGGGFEYRSALPAPIESESFRVDGYTFQAGAQMAVLTLTQEMVDRGAVIDIDWAAR